MYLPTAFTETDPAKIQEFMRRNSFAVLTTNSEIGLIASHLPLLFDSERGAKGQLLGHMARANSQWRDVKGEAMAVFSGPHAYISPTWYEERGTVPTWNYVAVHAYGVFEIVEDREGLLEILRRSVAEYESPMPSPWPFDESEPTIEGLLKAIVGFRVAITKLEAKWKLNQNHSRERRKRVIAALAARADQDSLEIARLMAMGLS